MSETYHKAVKADEVEERSMLALIIQGWPVLVTRDEGKVHALINRCSHAASPLAPDGRVRRGAVMCPLHGARFKLENGECMGNAGYKPLKLFPLRETDDGWVEIAVPDEAPGAEHLPVKPLG